MRRPRTGPQQITIPLFTDTAEPGPTSARVLFGYQSDPGREVAARSEGVRVGDARDQCGGQLRAYSLNAIEALARLIGAVPCQDHSIKVQDLLFEAEQLAAQRSKTCTHNIGDPFVARIGDDMQQFLDAFATDRCNDAKLGKVSADRM